MPLRSLLVGEGSMGLDCVLVGNSAPTSSTQSVGGEVLSPTLHHLPLKQTLSMQLPVSSMSAGSTATGLDAGGGEECSASSVSVTLGGAPASFSAMVLEPSSACGSFTLQRKFVDGFNAAVGTTDVDAAGDRVAAAAAAAVETTAAAEAAKCDRIMGSSDGSSGGGGPASISTKKEGPLISLLTIDEAASSASATPGIVAGRPGRL